MTRSSFALFLMLLSSSCSNHQQEPAPSKPVQAQTKASFVEPSKQAGSPEATKPKRKRRKRIKLPALDPAPRLPSRYNAAVGLPVGPEQAPPANKQHENAALGPKTNSDLESMAKAAVDGKPQGNSAAQPIERLKDGRIAVGRILVDRKKRQVEIPGRVAMTQGILEYLVVGPLGKAYESVLTHQGLPSQVHLGLLLIGLEPQKRGGPPVEIWVEWTLDGKKKRVRAEDLMLHRNLKKSPPPLVWRFFGSSFWNGRYSGDSSHTLISLIHDPNAVIILEDDAGNPYRGDHLGYEVYKKQIAPRGTEVTLIIRPAKT